MIAGVMRLGDRPVRAVMVPRADVLMVDVKDAPSAIAKRISESGHSRFVVFDGTPETILGVVQAKDLAVALLGKRKPNLSQLVKQAPVIHDTVDALEVVSRLRDSPVHFGLVYDEYGQFEGTVRDSTGAVLPGATVTVTNQQTGLTRVAVTSGDGFYRLPGLNPGLYSIRCELSGFTTQTLTDIVLTIQQTVIQHFSLPVAQVEETVTVTGESPIIDTTRSDVATAVSTAQIQDLPVASRRWIDLALLVPGVSQDNIRGFYCRGNANIGAGTRMEDVLFAWKITGHYRYF